MPRSAPFAVAVGNPDLDVIRPAALQVKHQAACRFAKLVSPRGIYDDRKSFHQGELIMAKATFGAGCFWGVEAAFRRIPGVLDAACGYAGGKIDNPTYRQVCSDNTDHAEVVEVEYDPAQVSSDPILDAFWHMP